MLGKDYAGKVLDLARRAADSQYETIARAADLVYASLREGGLLHVFGCGHSHILCEELFYRAGGLVPVNPIFETSAMLHEGAVKSSQIERMSGYAPLILDRHNVKAGEVLIVFSTSGINAMPIEMARCGREKGLRVVSVSSENYHKSRHQSGKRLCDFADIAINTGVPHGDALLDLEKCGMRAVPGSTVVATVVLNMLVAEVLERYERDGAAPPIFVSGNTEGGFERNLALIDRYRCRIKSL